MATADGTGKIYINHKEWVEFILKSAPFLQSTEFALGPIEADEDGFSVEYAFSEECHPKDWAHPPWWLKVEKKGDPK